MSNSPNYKAPKKDDVALFFWIWDLSLYAVKKVKVE